MAKRRRDPISLKPVGVLALLAAVGVTLYYIPPVNIFVVAAFIVLFTGCTYATSTLFTKSRKTQILISLFIAAFLISNLIAGFNLLNTLLLLSFIIGIRLLIG